MAESCTEGLRREASHWSLHGDQQLLDVLQGLHQRILEKCQETNTKLELMVTALDDASIQLQNVNNRFTALSNSQFIESRVFDDDADVITETEPPKVQQESKHVSEQERMQRSLQVLERLHESVTILCDSDSESGSDDDNIARVVLKPKDLYADRPLPYIIGSQAWKAKWHAGLLPDDSDSDSASVKEARKSEEYSHSDSDSQTETAGVYRQPRRSSSLSSTDLETEPESSVPHSVPTQSDIAAELARKLGGGVPKMPEVEVSPPSVAVRKVYKPFQPAPGNVFLDEPPPLDSDQSEDTDQDDIFAEINKNQPYNQSNKDRISVADDLFGRPIFDDIEKTSLQSSNPPAKQKPLLFEDESEPELFVVKPPPAPTNKTEVPKMEEPSVKKPVGGMSLFGSNANAESIGAAILKRNQRLSSPSDDDTEEDTPQIKKPVAKPTPEVNTKEIKKEPDTRAQKERDIFEDLFAKSEKINKDKSKTKVLSDKKETETAKPKIDLFSDDIFDDIDDIFTTNVKVVSKDEKKTQKSIFEDDDDLFPDDSKSKTDNKSDAKNKKSVFDDDLFNDEPVEIINTSKEIKTKSIKETKSIFDDSDDDLFTNFDKSSKRVIFNEVKASNIVSDSVKNATIDKAFFDSDDDKLFSASSNVKEKQNVIQEAPKIITNLSESSESYNKEPTKIVKSPDIFDDDDDALFQSTQDEPITNVKIERTNESKGEDLFNDEFKSDARDKQETTITKIKTKDDEAKHDSKSDATTDNISENNDTLFSKSVEETTGHTKNQSPILEQNNKDDVSVSNKRCFTVDKSFTHHEIVQTAPKSDESQNEVSSATSAIETKKDTTADKVSELHDDSNIVTKPKIAQKPSINKAPLFEEQSSKSNRLNVLDNMKSLDANKNVTDFIFEDIISPTVLPNAQSTNLDTEAKTDLNQDIFNDIFDDQPPVFEKPKEPKRSKNVNALFDDDSDDESLFFKKNDIISDERPEGFVSSQDRLFGLFIDEPPAIDVDFVAKTEKKDANSDKSKTNLFDDEDEFMSESSNNDNQSLEQKDLKLPKDLDDNSYQNVLFGNLDKENLDKLHENFTNEDAQVDDEDLFKTSKPKDNHVSKDTMPDILSKTETLNKDIDEFNTNHTESKKIGKLKPMNFNINVNTLLPGASPKKVAKTIDNIDGQTPSKSNDELYTDVTIKDDLEPKLVKSISFEGKPESPVLDNKLSKERAKIQVKRRPSTRRARKEAVKKSGIEFGDDSTDNSSSIDDPPRKTNKAEPPTNIFAKEEIVLPQDSKNELEKDVDSVNTKEINITNDNLVPDNIFKGIDDSHKDITENIEKNIPENLEDVKKYPKNDISLEQQKEIESSSRIAETKDVKSKVVYILHDEDIFDTKAHTSHQNTNYRVENENFDDLFKTGIQENKIIESNVEIDAKIEKKYERPDDLFKTVSSKEVTGGVTTLGQVYKESKQNKTLKLDFLSDSDDDLFKSSKTTKDDNKKHVEERKKPKANTEKNLFDDSDDLFKSNNNKTVNIAKKQSLFGSDSDEELFGGNKSEKDAKKREDTKRKETKVEVKKASLFDDDDIDLFGGAKEKKSFESKPEAAKPTTTREVISKPSQPVFEDPLSLFGSDNE